MNGWHGVCKRNLLQSLHGALAAMKVLKPNCKR